MKMFPFDNVKGKQNEKCDAKKRRRKEQRKKYTEFNDK